MQPMKARLLLARNIHAVLVARGENQTALAAWCRKKPSWINKILAGKRPLHIDDFDRVADFLGLSVYQLFQPGISALTERRKSAERRAGSDRRIGHAERTIQLRDAPQGGRHEKAPSEAAKAAISDEVRDRLTEAWRSIDSLLQEAQPGRQAPTGSAPSTKPRARR